ncbi:LytTR family DNA-binding domain-containing protein [Tissierella sp.]|uniref:LytR/AlgR family response regulator transcription factor n=1 Tax=Tissierella sp. TaxID=41274 RepID=UPI002866C0DA|nr:LytTR family DNA-binding domain-containing protein [Tissierella sp.]MDR7857513.1 LytTR family DNA-binding domain-containing protein [Tissierella sp.]
MKIAIIDDEKPARSELKYLISKVLPHADIVEASNGESALNMISQQSFDLLCIDINLGDISGITLASTARKLLPKAEIVFATAYNNHAEDAFAVEALDYLLKPFSEEKVKLMVDKYNKKHELEINAKAKKLTRIPINIDRKIILVDVSSIIYIESQNKNCIIHTMNDKYVDNTPLKVFEDKLKSNGFFRIQKSYLVNTKYIMEIYPWFNNSYCVRMKYFEDEVLSVSRNKIKDLKELLKI